MIFYAVVTLLGALDLAFWRWADQRLRSLTSPLPWRIALAFLIAPQFAIMVVWVMFPWVLGWMGGRIWIPMTAWIYMWHLLVLPVTMFFLLVGWIGRLVAGWVVRFATAPAAREPVEEAGDGKPLAGSSRRQLLGACAAFIPKAALAGGLFAAYQQAGLFRVNRMILAIPSLPPALEGLTIAHITDTHAGRFVNEPQLDAVVRATAGLKPDLIAFTGDLIDFNLSDLPMSIDAMRRLARLAPMAMCVGNHDLFEDGIVFRQRVLAAGLPLLCDESADLYVRGQRIEILGLDWGAPDYPRSAMMERHMAQLLSRRQGRQFSILLAHHPHAFDDAARAGIGLTLAGHTHGGQIMLTSKFGAGNVFKYWSGIYRQGDQRLVVANGVGNWFPLRINAPAEIVHLTLARA